MDMHVVANALGLAKLTSMDFSHELVVASIGYEWKT